MILLLVVKLHGGGALMKSITRIIFLQVIDFDVAADAILAVQPPPRRGSIIVVNNVNVLLIVVEKSFVLTTPRYRVFCVVLSNEKRYCSWRTDGKRGKKAITQTIMTADKKARDRSRDSLKYTW